MTGYLELVVLIGAPLYVLAVVLYTFRLVRGPTIPDAVLAADCIAYDLAVFLTALALYYKTPFMIAPPIMLALWAYLLDIYVSKYLASREVGA
ncbi:MAG: monovalent cation/H+ antiporter complex subunit F [Desulfurococcaceae archaeon]|jgi:multicomponent Na+:H+ antiporter subunit F